MTLGKRRPSYTIGIHAALVSILLLAFAGCAAPPKTSLSLERWEQTRADVALQLAAEHINSGSFDRARRLLGDFEKTRDIRVRIALARIDVEEGRYADALGRLSGQSEESEPPAAYYDVRGVALEGLGRWGEAALNYERAYSKERTAQHLMGWIEALVLSGDSTAAQRVLERERGGFPGNPGMHVLAARLCERMGDFSAVVGELRAALLAYPDSLEIQRRLAEALSAVDQHNEAIQIWRKLAVAERDGDEGATYQRKLAACLLSAKRFSEARTSYRELSRGPTASAADSLGLALADLALGQPAEALDAALAALKQAPGNTEARIVAALCCRRLNQSTRAVELLSAATGGNSDARVRKLLAFWCED